MTCDDAVRVEGGFFQRTVPDGMVNVDITYLDAMLLRIAHELGRRIKSHGLGIEDRRAKDIGIEGLEPRGGIDQKGEGGGMAFGEAVVAEAFDLFEATLGELARISARN